MFYMNRIDRITVLNRRIAALPRETLPESSTFLLTECAQFHAEKAFGLRLASGVAADYHWALADSYVSFVEQGQLRLAAMMADAIRLCSAD